MAIGKIMLIFMGKAIVFSENRLLDLQRSLGMRGIAH
jgi:hypothetical protein